MSAAAHAAMLSSALTALRDYQQMSDNLAAVQSRCGELLEEARAARAERDALKRKLDKVVRELERAHAGILLPGWTCRECRVFNGSAKGLLDACRSCGAARRAA